MVEIYNTMRLTSPVFNDEQYIPDEYTCDAQENNPPLLIEDIPKEANSLVLIMDDLDAEAEGIKNHWLVWNIPAQQRVEIQEGELPPEAITGRNDYDVNEYVGECPQVGTHRYRFSVYAIDKYLNLDSNSDLSDVMREIEDSILAQTSLTGLYKRSEITDDNYEF